MRLVWVLVLLSALVAGKRGKKTNTKFGETLNYPRYNIGLAHFNEYNGTQHVFQSDIAMVQDKNCSAPKDTSTAICLAGHARGFNYPEIQQSITEATKCFGTNVKLFLVLYQDLGRNVSDLVNNTSNFPRAYAEFHENTDYPANLTTPKANCTGRFEGQTRLMKGIGRMGNIGKSVVYHENISMFGSGMQINYKMERCYSAVEAYEKNNSMRFDFIARIRPDTYWVGLPKQLGRRMEEVKARKENMCFFADGINGPDMCDHFALCSREAAYSYLAKPTRDYAKCEGNFKKQFGYDDESFSIGGYWKSALIADNVSVDIDKWYFALARHREKCYNHGCHRLLKNEKTQLADMNTQKTLIRSCNGIFKDICDKYKNTTV